MLSRKFAAVLPVAFAAILIGSLTSAAAQTWDYSQSSSILWNLPPLSFPLAQGFSYAVSGVAVDSKGDIFLGVLGNDAGYDFAIGELCEIEAINGVIGPDSPVVYVSIFGPPDAYPVLHGSSVMGVAVDSAGNVYVSDGVSTIYEVAATNGVIYSTSTVTQYSTGWQSPAGIAIGPNGNVFFANSGGGDVEQLEWLESSGVVHVRRLVSTGVGAGFTNPFGLTFDASGNLYVSDTFSGGVSKVTPSSGVFSTKSAVTSVAGPLSLPGFIALDRQGNLLVHICTNCSSTSQRIQEVVAVNGSVSPSSPVVDVADDLTNAVGGLAAYPDGNILVGFNGSVCEIQHPTANFGSAPVGNAGTIVSVPYYFTLPGSVTGWQISAQGAASSDFTVVPAQTTCSTTATFQAGESCSVAVQFTPKHAGMRTSAIVFSVQSTNEGPVTTGTIFPLKGVGLAAQAFFPDNRSAITVASGFKSPWGLAIDGSGNIYVAGWGDNTVKQIVAVNGSIHPGAQVATIGDGFNSPSGVAVDDVGNLYVANSADTGIFEIASPGTHMPQLQTATQLSFLVPCTGHDLISALALDADGNVFMPTAMDGSCSSAVYEYPSATGQPMSGSGLLLLGLLPPVNTVYRGMAFDSQGNLYLTDPGNGYIWKVQAIGGRITSSSSMVVVGSGFKQPIGIAIDAAGDVFFTDTQDVNVQEIVAVDGQVSTASPVITIASGFNDPYGLAFDSHGNLFVSENRLGTVVEIPLAAPPSLHFATPTTAGKVDQTDGALTATVANSGNNPLTFVLPGMGMNPSLSTSFVWDSSSTCEQSGASTPTAFSLAPGSSCTVAVRFKPVASGTVQGQIVITDNSLNAPAPGYVFQSISLSGIGDRAAQTLTFRAIAANVHAHSSIELIASSTSRLTVSFTSKTPKVCTVSGSKASLLTAGSCTIEAQQTGNIEYLAAHPVSHTFTILHASQQISFPAITTHEHAKETLVLKAAATSDLRVAFTSKTPTVCAINGATAQLLRPGTCTITATQGGNAAYAAAASVTRSFSVAKAD